MPLEPNESQLAAQARQGDREAFGDLYELYLDELYRYVFYRVNHRLDAEDLTEQVFLKAWEKLSHFRGEIPFRSWLYRIARNTVVDHYRTRKQTEPLNEANSPIDPVTPPEAHVLNREETNRIVTVIARLAPLQQDVLLLRFIMGLSAEETAQVLDRSAGSVRVTQHRALKEMQALLQTEDIVNG